jgi:hypothetical protein
MIYLGNNENFAFFFIYFLLLFNESLKFKRIKNKEFTVL